MFNSPETSLTYGRKHNLISPQGIIDEFIQRTHFYERQTEQNKKESLKGYKKKAIYSFMACIWQKIGRFSPASSSHFIAVDRKLRLNHE